MNYLCHFAGIGQVTADLGIICETQIPYGQSVMIL